MTTLTILTILVFLSISITTYANVSCPVGSFNNGKKCTLCPKGTYQSEPDQKTCIQCPFGHYNNFRGAKRKRYCALCPPGTYSHQGSSKCTPCPPGKYSQAPASKCLKCAPGYGLWLYSNNCQPCDGGYYNDGSFKYCQPCPHGTVPERLSGAKKCIVCPPGTYKDPRQATYFPKPQCAPCPLMTYSDQYRTRQCKLCPLGTYTNVTGSKSCIPCPSGTSRGRVKQDACQKCRSGTSSKGIGAAACKHIKKGCPWGTFQDRNGECRACMPGERFDEKSLSCVQCGPNEVSGGGARTQCKRCPKNEQPAGDETIFEKSFCECIPGFKRKEDGLCRPCPVGTFGVTDLLKTARGAKRSSKYVRPHCDACRTGTHGDETGLTRCKICEKGTYSVPGEFEKPTSCTPCSKGTTTEALDPHYESPYDDYVVNPFGACYDIRSGCYEGDKPDENGNCKPSFCSENTFLDKKNPEYGCQNCNGDAFLNMTTTSCQLCPPNTMNPIFGHARTTCMKCKAGEVFRINRCVCQKNFRRVSGGCEKCPTGKVAIGGGCWNCLTGIAVMSQGVTTCKLCKGNSYKAAPLDKKCTLCPEGHVREKDVVGNRVNGCMPKNSYEF